MVNEDFRALGNRCYCLFDCECDKVEKRISEWTSLEALETVKNRLLSLSDPNDIFARFACMLFFREILDGGAVKSSKDNLRKATIAFSFAASFANEENDCQTFYASCWQRFQHLATILDKNLSHITIRRRLPLSCFVDEVFSLDAADSNIASSLAAEVQIEHVVSQFVQPHSLEEVNPQLDHSITMTVQNLDNRQIEESASNSEENNSQTLPPLISPMFDALSLDVADDFQPMMSLDSSEPNHTHSPTSEVANERNARDFDGYQSDLDDPSLDEEKPPAEFMMPMSDLQNENVSLRGPRSMPSESANQLVVERSESKKEEKKPKIEAPVDTNGLESADEIVTQPVVVYKQEPEEVAEPCDTLNATTSQPCQNAQTETAKRSENRGQQIGEPKKKRARPVVAAADCTSSSEHADSRPSMEVYSQSVFSLDSAGSNIALSLTAEVQDEHVAGQFVQPLSHFTVDTPLEAVNPQLDGSITVTVQGLDSRQFEGSASNSEDNNAQTLPPLISTIVDALSLDVADDFQPMLPLDSSEPNHSPSSTSEVANEWNAREFHGYHSHLDDPSLDEENPSADFVFPTPDLQNEISTQESMEQSEDVVPEADVPLPNTSGPRRSRRTRAAMIAVHLDDNDEQQNEKRVRPVVAAADCTSSSEHADSRPSMVSYSQSTQEPMEQSDVAPEADVPLSNTSGPRRSRWTRAATIAGNPDDNDEQPSEKRVSERLRNAKNGKSALKSTNIGTTYFMLNFWYKKGDRPLSQEIKKLAKMSDLTVTKVKKWFGHRRQKGVPHESIERSMLMTEQRDHSYFEVITSSKIDNAAPLLKEFYKMIDHPFASTTQVEKIATAAGLPQHQVKMFFHNRRLQLRAHAIKKSATVSEQLKQFGISEERLRSFDWIKNKKALKSTDSRTSGMLCRFYAVNMNSNGRISARDIPESTRSLLVQLTGWPWSKKIKDWFGGKQRFISGKSLSMLRSIAKVIRHPHEFRFGVGRNAKFDYFEDRYLD